MNGFGGVPFSAPRRFTVCLVKESFNPVNVHVGLGGKRKAPEDLEVVRIGNLLLVPPRGDDLGEASIPEASPRTGGTFAKLDVGLVGGSILECHDVEEAWAFT